MMQMVVVVEKELEGRVVIWITTRADKNLEKTRFKRYNWGPRLSSVHAQKKKTQENDVSGV